MNCNIPFTPRRVPALWADRHPRPMASIVAEGLATELRRRDRRHHVHVLQDVVACVGDIMANGRRNVDQLRCRERARPLTFWQWILFGYL